MEGAGGVLVNAKLALVIPGLPTTDDSTMKFPGALLAVNVMETASPIVSVMAIIVCRFSAKVPVAGFVGGFELGAANCTWMLGTGSPLESTTLAVNGFANAVTHINIFVAEVCLLVKDLLYFGRVYLLTR